MSFVTPNVGKPSITPSIASDTSDHGWRNADCGKSFMPKRSDAKFCSAACKQRAYHHRIKPTASGPTRFDRRALGEN